MTRATRRTAGSGDGPELIIERAKRRDPAAFEALYRRYHPRVYSLALRISCDPLRADELTQDVFVQVWKSLSGFRGEAAFGTWLHTLAVRICLNANRKARRRDRHEHGVADPDAYAFAARRAMPETDVDLERALAALPARAREVLVLHDVYGYRHREIGELLRIAEGTTKAHLHRARRLMRAALES